MVIGSASQPLEWDALLSRKCPEPQQQSSNKLASDLNRSAPECGRGNGVRRLHQREIRTAWKPDAAARPPAEVADASDRNHRESMEADRNRDVALPGRHRSNRFSLVRSRKIGPWVRF